MPTPDVLKALNFSKKVVVMPSMTNPSIVAYATAELKCMMKADARRSVITGCMAAMQRLWKVLEMKAPFTTNSSRLHAKKAPRTNSLRLGCGVWSTQENKEPAANGIVQTRFEANASPNIRLSEIIESGSSALTM